MSDRSLAEQYESAISQLESHIHRAADGTLRLDIQTGASLGIDPVIFADLQRSLEETNQKIRRGELKAEDVTIGR